jgi:hypothetical protein
MALFPIRNVGLKLLSVAVAVLLWLVVAGDPIVERTLRVGVELQRTPPGSELVGSAPDSVTVRVRGPASQLADLAPGDLSVVVDLEGVRAGRRLFALTPSQVTAPYGLEIVQIVPPTLPLTFEASASKIVPVRAQLEGTPAPGHSVTNVSVTPSQVRVTGPESAVERLAEVVTEPVSVERGTTLVREAVSLDVSDTGARLTSGGIAVVTITIAADASERTVFGVPIAIRGAAQGAAVLPASAAVTVLGADEVVRRLGPADVSLFVVVGSGPAGPSEVAVHAESSARYVVRSIDPPAVRVRAGAPPP